MANGNSTSDRDWTEKVKSGGAVPYLDPNNCSNGWASPPGDIFKVRGPEYFSNRVKIPAGEYLLKPLGFDWIKSSSKICEVLNNPHSRVQKVIKREFHEGERPFIWAFNLQVPSKENYSAVAYFASDKPAPEGSLVERFLEGDDTFRNSRLKLIANIVKGPWIVKKAVGEQAICVIGRALTCKYFKAQSFLEVDIDIGSSMLASAIVHLAFGYITTLTVDLAFLIESQTSSELPERILGAVRFSDLNPASAKSIESSLLEESTYNEHLHPSRAKSWWKTLGQGFSHLIQHGSQEGSHSGSTHLNGKEDHGSSNNKTGNW